MVQLAAQLVERESGKYGSADLEDRYETRLRAMIDAKLKGEGIDLSADVTPEPSNVIDLMAALKKSLGQAPGEQSAAPKRKKASDSRQTGLKLPIKGGKAAAERTEKVSSPATMPVRKRA